MTQKAVSGKLGEGDLGILRVEFVCSSHQHSSGK